MIHLIDGGGFGLIAMTLIAINTLRQLDREEETDRASFRGQRGRTTPNHEGETHHQ